MNNPALAGATGRRMGCVAAAVVFVSLALLASSAAASRGTPPPGVVRGHIVDYGRPGGAATTAFTAMATDFKVGKQRWFGLPKTVYYDVNNCASTCESRVNSGFDPWERSGVTLTESGRGHPASNNLCTGSGNSVTFASIDGPGNVLAETYPCYYLASGELIGFDILFDSDDTWSDCTSSCPSNAFSIQAVATHESGHVVGLNHVRALRDDRLTMYPYINYGDFGFATLGCGDQLGIDKLYSKSFTCTANVTVPLD